MSVRSDFFARWFEQQDRHFPWREENVSPFHVLVTEMLLRQTRAGQVADLWESFTSKHPNARVLASAPQEEIYEDIHVLGFGSQRSEALLLAASYLVEHHDGEVPREKDKLLQIPHVGLYTAHAVLCFAFKKAVPVVDTNILRLFARLEGKKVQQPDIRRNPWVWDLAWELVPEDGHEAERHNYGLLDFTALICKPRVPRCEVCPLSSECFYGSKKLSGESVTPPW